MNHWEKKVKQLVLNPAGRAALKKVGIDVELVKDKGHETEKPIVAILCPSYRAPEPEMQNAMGAMVNYTRQKNIATVYSVPMKSNSVVHWSRNFLITEHLKSGHPWTHVLFMDDDIVPDPNTLEKLLSHNKDIIAGLCTRRSDPPIPNMRHCDEVTGEWSFIWEWPLNQVIEVSAVGTGLILISKHALEQVAQQYFDCLWEKDFYGLGGERLEEMKAQRIKEFDETKTCYWFRFLPDLKNGMEIGEDVSFCLVARKYCNIPVFVDTSVQPGHMGFYDFGIKDFLPHQKQCIAMAKASGKYAGTTPVEEIDWRAMLPNVIPEVAVPSPECPNPEKWHCFDEMATEVEVLDLLYALVRALKPKIIVETGTYVGLGALYMARALKENGTGHLHTSEVREDIAKKADVLLKVSGFGDVITLHQKPGEEMISGLDSIDFAFLDSNLDTRMGEMETLFSKLSPSAVVAVHDTSTNHDKINGPRTPFVDFAKRKGLQLIQFDTPRGLTLLRKPYQDQETNAAIRDNRTLEPAYRA